MFVASLVLTALMQSPELLLDPQVSEVVVFKPGIVYVIREATVPAGLHQYRLKSAPQALDGTLWYETPDAAQLSELRTTIDLRGETGKKKIVSIPELLAGSVGRDVQLQIRVIAGNATRTENLKGKLLSFDERGAGTLLLANRHMRPFDVSTVTDIDTAGLPSESVRIRPRVDVRFRVNATRPSRIRFCSMEFGAAWVENYRLKMSGSTGKLECAAQLGLGSLRLSDSRVRLATGVPNLIFESRTDLISGANSLSGYLSNQPSKLAPSAVDPFEIAESMISSGSNRTSYPTLTGGTGLVGDSIDFVSYDPTDNSLVVRGDRQAPAIFARAIEASRLEDLHLYDFGGVSLSAGGRITRIMSTVEVPLKNIYRWDASESGGFKRVLLLHNSTSAGWPAGLVFFQSDGVPLAQITMPFTAPDQDAYLFLGEAEDLVHNLEVHEVSRQPIVDLQYPSAIQVTYAATLEVTNTRSEALEIEVNYSARGRMTESDGATVVKGALQDLLNPSNNLSWKVKLAPGEHKRWRLQFRTIVN